MKIAAIICNVVLFLFTCFVLATDGLPTKAEYIVFTLLLLLVSILSAAALSRFSLSPALKTAAVIGNIVVLGHSIWSYVSQYPHPKEEGYVPYVVLLALTPIISLAALLRAGRTAAGQNP